jgi:hypothetical protein
MSLSKFIYLLAVKTVSTQGERCVSLAFWVTPAATAGMSLSKGSPWDLNYLYDSRIIIRGGIQQNAGGTAAIPLIWELNLTAIRLIHQHHMVPLFREPSFI